MLPCGRRLNTTVRRDHPAPAAAAGVEAQPLPRQRPARAAEAARLRPRCGCCWRSRTRTRSGSRTSGIRIIHHILNQRPDAAAELTFAPWPDAEAEMRRLGIPLFSLDSHAPAERVRRDRLLAPVRAPVHERARHARPRRAAAAHASTATSAIALVIAGGAQAFSPEPMAEFIDAFVIGDGEEVIHAVVDLVRALASASAGRGRGCCGGSRTCRGVYVPCGLRHARHDRRAGWSRCRGPASRRASTRCGCRSSRASTTRPRRCCRSARSRTTGSRSRSCAAARAAAASARRA